MYDYKNRQSDLSFRKPKGTWHKGLRRVIGLALTAGILYGVVQLALSWQRDSKEWATDSNIIELPLPPHPKDGRTGTDDETGQRSWVESSHPGQ